MRYLQDCPSISCGKADIAYYLSKFVLGVLLQYSWYTVCGMSIYSTVWMVAQSRDCMSGDGV